MLIINNYVFMYISKLDKYYVSMNAMYLCKDPTFWYNTKNVSENIRSFI